jgi:uncharacterized membrane protein YGL010W
MPKIKTLLDEYALSHQNPTNILIHKIFVPLIVFSLIGLLLAIPEISGLKPVYLVVFLVGIYYWLLSKKYFLIAFPAILLMLGLNIFIMQYVNIFYFSFVVFIISWILQFYGHKIEGRSPSFLKDLQFLLIGPLWVLKSLFKIKD